MIRRPMLVNGGVILVSIALLAGCSKTATDKADPDSDLATRAANLAQQSIIVDTHVDVPYRLEEQWSDVSAATTDGDFDYPRAVAGGLNVPFMSIYTPAEQEVAGTSKATAERLIDMVSDLVATSPDKFAIALSADDVEKQFAAGLISLPMGMENGSPIEGDLQNVRYFFDRGIRYITLTHGMSNHISDSSYDDNKQWGGLSEFGQRVVREMNSVGIMVDISHVSDDAFYDALAISGAPLIASHSSSRHFTPGFERNMSDDMVGKLAENGGVIMVNFGSSFVTEKANTYSRKRSDAWDAHVEETADESADQAREEFNEAYAEEHGPYPFADIEDILNQFDHLIDIAGIDHVGIGSDYDGVGDSLPTGLKDVSSYPNLVEGLLRRGYSDYEISKVLGLNLLRVWRQVEEIAATSQGDTA